MRVLAFAAAAAFVLGAGLASTPADAKEYAVKYLGSKALAGTCARGGGTFHQSTAISHSCTYKNGNVRDCSSKSKTCVVITPGKAKLVNPTSPGGVPAGGATAARTGGGGGGGAGFECNEPETSNKKCYCTGDATSEDCKGMARNCDDALSCFVTPKGIKKCSCHYKPAPLTANPGGKPTLGRGEGGVLTEGGLLDTGPRGGPQGPASTGAPLSTGGGAPPPRTPSGRIN